MNTQTLPMRFSQSAGKRVRALLSGLILIGGGILALEENHRLIGYTIISFFAITTLVSAADLVLRRNYIEISKEGLTVSSLSGAYFVSWNQVQSFRVVGIVGARFVGWDYSSNFSGMPFRRRLNTFLVGAEAMLADYGKVDELVTLLNGFRDQYCKK